MITSTPSIHEIAEWVELGEAEAWAELFRATPADATAEFGMRVERVGSAVAFITEKLDIMLLNRVIGLGLQRPATEAMVNEIIALYQSAGVHNFAVQVSPVAQPADLPAWLEACRLPRRDNWAKVYRGVEPPPVLPTELRLECIGPEQAAAFAAVACTAFGMPDALRPWLAAVVGRPGWRHYLAWSGAVPVATGALFVRGELGWLGAGSTLPSHRRRGAQGAIMAQRIRDGIELGCRWFVTETGQASTSYRNMIRAGFQLAYQRPNYIFS